MLLYQGQVAAIALYLKALRRTWILRRMVEYLTRDEAM
jgi:hypothetical protein